MILAPMLSGAAITSPLVAAIVSATFPPVSVSVAPGLACPTNDAVERAIAAVREGAPASTGPSYRLRLAAAGPTIRADLTSADGAAVWTRMIPAGPAACSSGAEAVALIVEREFREIAWTPPAAAPSPPARADRPGDSPPPPAPSVASAPAAGVVTARSLAPDLPSFGPRMAASVGPALWSRGGTAAVSVEARLRVAGAWQAGLGAIVPPSSTSLTLYTGADGSAPQATVTVVPFLVAFGVERPVARRVDLGAAAEGLLTFERGESAGIAAPRTAWRSVLAGGVAGGGALALGDRVRLDVRVGAYRTLLGRSFTVDGVAGDVLEPPAWQALVRVGLGWVFVP